MVRLKHMRQLIASGQQRAIWILLRNAFEMSDRSENAGGHFHAVPQGISHWYGMTELSVRRLLKVFPAHPGNIKTCLKEIRAGRWDTQFLQLFSCRFTGCGAVPLRRWRPASSGSSYTMNRGSDWGRMKSSAK